MSEHVVSGLARRRAEVAGELEMAVERVRRLHDDLAALDAVIRQFDADFDISGIRPRRRRRAAARRGETWRAVLDVLRAARAPMEAAAVAERLIAERGLDGQGRAARRRVVDRVGVALRRQRDNGAARSCPGPGRVVLWEIVR